MPRDVFVAGQVLTAAEMNALQDQAVMTFANAAARGSAIAAPTEGMVTHLQDSDLVTIYDGSAWKTSVGVTGGVLQVVQADFTGTWSTSSTTLQETSLTANITPKSSSNKVFVIASLAVGAANVNDGQNGIYTIRRNNVASSPIGDASGSRTSGSKGSGDSAYTPGGTIITWLDSPASTSSTTYSVWARMTRTPGTVYLNTLNDSDAAGSIRAVSSLTLIELAG